MEIRNVVIVGKGALGLLFGGQIERALGPGSVRYLMDDARYERDRARHITINGEPCLLADVRAGEAAPADLIIVCVKAYGLDDAIDSMARAVGPSTRIISFMNGITSERRIAARYGWEHVALSVVQGMDATFIGDTFTYTHPGEVRMGAAEGTGPEVVPDIARLFDRCGIRYTVEDDMWRRLWVKFTLNVGINQTCMVYGGTYGSVVEPESEQLRSYVAAMREAAAVGHAEGVEVTERDISEMVALAASLEPDGMPSMAQDRINKKPSEVEEFAGTVIRLAERHSILVPQNRWLYRRIHEIEAAY